MAAASVVYSRYDFAGDDSTGTPALKKDEKLTLVKKVRDQLCHIHASVAFICASRHTTFWLLSTGPKVINHIR